jgi:hypothetical protein
MKLACIGSLVAVAALAGVAQAADLSRVMKVKVEDPYGTVETAKAMAPPWCKSIKDLHGSDDSAFYLASSLEQDNVMEAAPLTCLWPTDPAVAHAVQVILQSWMNSTGETQAEAIESLSIRLNKDKLKADGDKLCATLKPDAETDGEESQFIAAEMALYGCRYGNTNSPLWQGNNTGVGWELFPFLDLSDSQPNELVRLAYLLTSQKYIFSKDRNYFDQALVSYVVTQFDFALLSSAGLTKALAEEPFKDNSYARTIGLESEAMARLAGNMIKKEVDARSAKDPDWKTVLVTAPQAGAKAWTEMAAKYKDQVAHSNAFEHKWYGPSKKAYAGCWKELHDDFLTVLKDQKHATENELKDSLQNPILSLLWGRLVACSSSDKDSAYTAELYFVSDKIRPARGMRTAAYYAAAEAFGPIKSDREKFPVEAKDLASALKIKDDLVTGGYREKKESQWDTMGFGTGYDGEGTVKSTKKIKQGLEVTFVGTKQQFMGRSCTPTNRIIQFRADGSPVYYENCHDTGLYWSDTTPANIVLPDPEWESVIKPGVVIGFRSTRDAVKLGGDKYERYGVPSTVYSDKSKKKLVGWMGFAMP